MRRARSPVPRARQKKIAPSQSRPKVPLWRLAKNAKTVQNAGKRISIFGGGGSWAPPPKSIQTPLGGGGGDLPLTAPGETSPSLEPHLHPHRPGGGGVQLPRWPAGNLKLRAQNRPKGPNPVSSGFISFNQMLRWKKKTEQSLQINNSGHSLLRCSFRNVGVWSRKLQTRPGCTTQGAPGLIQQTNLAGSSRLGNKDAVRIDPPAPSGLRYPLGWTDRQRGTAAKAQSLAGGAKSQGGEGQATPQSGGGGRPGRGGGRGRRTRGAQRWRPAAAGALPAGAKEVTGIGTPYCLSIYIIPYLIGTPY